MKQIIIIIIAVFLFNLPTLAQDSVIVVQSAPQSRRAIKVALIINGIYIHDSTKVADFLNNSKSLTAKKSYLSREKALNKWGINEKGIDGIVVIETKRGILLDYNSLKPIEKK